MRRLTLATALLLIGQPAAQAGKPSGTLQVTCKPMAQVFVDGQSMGTTPVKVQHVTVGTHRVELRASDGRTQTFTVIVKKGQTKKLHHKFPKARAGGTGYLTVTSSPWSQVFVGGRAVGSTPLQRYALTARSYLVELKTSDGKSHSRRVYVLRGRNTTIHYDFPKKKKAPPPVAWLWVRSRPLSKVYVNARLRGTTPLRDLDVSPGRVEVELRTADGRVYKRVMRIPKDKTAKLSHVFKPRPRKARKPRLAYLYITCNVKARVNVDGTNVGFTPIHKLRVNPGRHRIRYRTSRGKRRTVYLRIKAGMNRNVHVTF